MTYYSITECGLRRMHCWTDFSRQTQERKSDVISKLKFVDTPRQRKKENYETVQKSRAKGELPEEYFIVLHHLDGHLYYLTDLDKTDKAAPCWTWKPRRCAEEAILFRTMQEAKAAADICHGSARKQHRKEKRA